MSAMNEGYDAACSCVGELLPNKSALQSRLLYSESRRLSRGIGVPALEQIKSEILAEKNLLGVKKLDHDMVCTYLLYALRGATQ